MTPKEMVEYAKTVLNFWMEGTPGGWRTYMDDELEALATTALASVPEAGLIVEIGSYTGYSGSVLMHVAREKQAKLVMIDPLYWTPDYAKTCLRELFSRFKDVDWMFYPLTSEEAHTTMMGEKQTLLREKPIDFLHLDGDHSGPGLTLDCQLWVPHVRSGAAVAFHDYNHYSTLGQGGICDAVDAQAKDWEVLWEGGYWGLTIRRKP